MEADFSTLTHNNQIFINDFVFRDYHLCKIAAQIIECKISCSLWTLYNTIFYIYSFICIRILCRRVGKYISLRYLIGWDLPTGNSLSWRDSYEMPCRTRELHVSARGGIWCSARGCRAVQCTLVKSRAVHAGVEPCNAR